MIPSDNDYCEMDDEWDSEPSDEEDSDKGYFIIFKTCLRCNKNMLGRMDDEEPLCVDCSKAALCDI